jgi:hypothetical protein
MRVFKAYDNLAKAMTLFVWVSTLSVSALVYFYTQLTLLPILLLISIAIPYLFSPRDFLITGKYLVIKKVFGEVKIPLEEIEEVKLLEKVKGIRTFGSGGLYGYFGYFHLHEIGSVKMYAARRSKLILIRCKNKKFVISPENPEEFIVELKKRVESV